MKTTPDTPITRIKNLDVLGLDQEPNFGCTKGGRGELAWAPLLSSLGAYAARPAQRHKHRRHYRADGTKYITVPQAANIIEALDFAKVIQLRLVAHLTIHWSLTDAGDDPDGNLFAKVREGLHKWLGRHGIVFAAAWSRERQSGGQSDVVHCHLLFHLPVEYRKDAKLLQVEAAITRLVRLHGGAISHEKAIDLRVHENPDGKYLIKGGGPKVWKQFNLRKEHRRLQGIIHGKRCGTTVNLGRAARIRAISTQEVA
jgi:hypothetical protein